VQHSTITAETRKPTALELALAQIGGLAQPNAEDAARRQRWIAAMSPAERAAFDSMAWGKRPTGPTDEQEHGLSFAQRGLRA
jgi:hypothetical protein